MRPLWMLMVVAPLAILPACAAYQTEATAPTVTYQYQDDDEYDLVAERADLYCEEQYDSDAVLMDREVDGTGYEATFTCE